MGTKNNPGKFDCYEKAEPDEPCFTLLARDRHAPVLVALWAALREHESEDSEIVREARQCVGDMTAWALEHDRDPVIGISGLGVTAQIAISELVKIALT